MSQKSPIVRSIDVGHGYVKWIEENAADAAPFKCGRFASRAAIPREMSLGGQVMQKRDTFIVNVGSKAYEVGKDVGLATGPNDITEVLSRDFAMSDTHTALLYGALSYIKQMLPGERDHIDFLVLGLPLTTYTRYGKLLEQRVCGEHEINAKGDKLTIRAVQVIPQPLGSFFYYGAANSKFEDFHKQTTLVIDPGRNSFDWLTCKGMTPIEAMSGANEKGMSEVVREIAIAMDKEFDLGASIPKLMEAIDDAFVSGEPLRLFSQEFEIGTFKPAGDTIVEQAVQDLANQIRDGMKIDNVVVTGGGSSFYLPTIKRHFPKHRVNIVQRSQFANVLGYQIMGEEIAKSAQRAGIHEMAV